MSVQINRSDAKKIWVFAFEFSGIAKVGGLGEVSANQCINLAKSPDINLTVFLPSHGRHEIMKNSLSLHPILRSNGETYIASGSINRNYFNIISQNDAKSNNSSDENLFKVEFWKGEFKGVPVILLVGTNPLSDYILNCREVYSAKTLNAKLGLFALAMKEFMRFCIDERPKDLPDIIHIHDHHPVAALFNCRQQLILSQRDVHTVITMHLLTWPRKNLQFFWESGVNNEKISAQIGDSRVMLTMREFYNLAQNGSSEFPTLETIGCLLADKVIAVSESFLHSDIIPHCGGALIKEKCDFTWNGCDWSYNSLVTDVFDKFHKELPQVDINTLRSWDFRKFLLTKKIGGLPASEPKISDREVLNFIKKQFSKPPYHPDGRVDNFFEDGPLVLITGRVSRQKGIETLLSAIPLVLKHFPNAKFLFLMVPSAFTLDDLSSYMKVAYQYPENIRFIFGIAGTIYFLSHLAADVYCCPSRWEPFGIVALEAMASRIPVVATNAGGLKESIVSLDKDPVRGTGLLVPIDQPKELSYALVSLLSIMHITERAHSDPLFTETEKIAYLSKIINAQLRKQIQNDSFYADKIKENAESRVEKYFRWSIVSKKLKEIYLSFFS
ncbi:MAG: glycosyltransferase family 4 protein [Candidatus Lokiarchaeota archaeon]|nr:glycosyltransferase family 4 protein [Candidatus Harpocratesius repetitus]